MPATTTTLTESTASGSPPSLAETVYEAILERILRGTLEPGTVLSAVRWADKLQVSRTPVHDALRMLTADGLVECPAGRRAQVADFTRDDLWEIFEMRRFLEGPAAELAAGRMDGRQLSPLREQSDTLARAGESQDWINRWSDFDEQFHAAIAASCGNSRLRRDIDRYRLVHRGFNRVSTDFESLQDAHAEHVEILEALEAHDGKAARAAMENHIIHWQRYFVERFR
jgi:DNA-binding GntR family transcriptional regulator